ncbi:MAG: S8 family peptidase [Rhodospirillales bacterium]|nr:MAG: S8 family peptidase [Rhodospirillales bacterium]
MTLEKEWERLGLSLLSSDQDKSLILFSSSDEVSDFRSRLEAYSSGIQPGRVAPPYSGFIGRIEEIGDLAPEDRIGRRLREQGYINPDDFSLDQSFVVDIELWDFGSSDLRQRKLNDIEAYITTHHGEVFDRYIGPSISLLRARLDGSIARSLLAVTEIATIDLPPEPDAATGAALALTADNLPSVSQVAADAPVIGLVDSGLNAHPLFEGAIAGAIGVPEALGGADDFGHGTRVGGVALFGDLRAQLGSNMLVQGARIASARVLNQDGKFDERSLVARQMRAALTTLNERFGCRLFVIALGDRSAPYDGGKVGTWAATLDELAHELNAVIIVAAGNNESPRSGDALEEAVTEYPAYLLEAQNRLFEPGGAINVLTVGSLAHGEGVGPEFSEIVHVRPITQALEPSPFTRIGPGPGKATKPDLVDIGGTAVFDAGVRRLRVGQQLPSAGILTLHHQPMVRLFASASGTSFAAPMVAHKAAQLLRQFPHASANLIRALLVNAARVPEEAMAKLQPLGDHAPTFVCGNGMVDVERAAYSDDHRVILFADDQIDIDHFVVYELPIPEIFQAGGRRSIRVSLAYDSPVRHTRADYAGVGMSFRLVRGCTREFVFDHFRRRSQSDGRQPELSPRFDCKLLPGPQQRERGTLQCASVSFQRGTENYGDMYYLVVRCERGWADVGNQQYAVVVELEHQLETRLYDRLQVRVRV